MYTNFIYIGLAVAFKKWKYLNYLRLVEIYFWKCRHIFRLRNGDCIWAEVSTLWADGFRFVTGISVSDGVPVLVPFHIIAVCCHSRPLAVPFITLRWSPSSEGNGSDQMKTSNELFLITNFVDCVKTLLITLFYNERLNVSGETLDCFACRPNLS